MPFNIQWSAARMNSMNEHGPGTQPRFVWKSVLFLYVPRYVLAAVFVMAGISKITDREGLLHALNASMDLSPFWAEIITAGLPWLELTTGLCLFFGYAIREAALVSSVLLVFFSIYSLSHLGVNDCGCFVVPAPVLSEPTWLPPVRDLLLLGASIWLAWRWKGN
jgi:putative oxidoreductase